MEADGYKQTVESDSKNKSLQTQVQALDIRIAGRYDPKKIYAYNPDILLSKMVTQLPPPFTLYSDKYWNNYFIFVLFFLLYIIILLKKKIKKEVAKSINY